VLIELGADRYQCFPTGYVGMLFPCLLFFRPGGAAATPEQVTSGRAAQVPDQNEASGYGAATPPTSFSDGSCFFDGAGGFFNSSSMSQPWMLNSNPATWY